VRYFIPIAVFVAASGACVAGLSIFTRSDLREIETGGRIRTLLEDKSQPWWNQHRPPTPKGTLHYSDPIGPDWGSEDAPPIFTSVMPIELVSWMHRGGRAPADHPLAGRVLLLLDLRGLADFAAERIAGSMNVPSEALELSIESGELSKVDRRSIIVVFGSKWPHYEAVTRLRGPDRFEAVYAMGGLDSWRAANLSLERDEKLARFNRTMKSALARDKAPGRPDESFVDVAGLDPRALEVLLDAGIDLMCIFVGDARTFADGHIPGSLHIPASEIPSRMKGVARNRLVVVFCGCCEGRRGGPSEAAFRSLREMSFTRVLHLDGHMPAWRRAGLPVEFGEATLRK